MLSEWSDSKPETILSNLKKQSDYYNYNQRTVGTFFSDVAKNGFSKTVDDRLAWGQMRMAPTDRSEEHTSELQSLMRISYAVFCLKKKKQKITQYNEFRKRIKTDYQRIYTSRDIY